MLVNSMKLAYQTFQSCRCLLPETEAFLETLIPILEKVRESGLITVDVSEQSIKKLPSEYRYEIEGDSESMGRPVGDSDDLLTLCSVAAIEMSRLWKAGLRNAVRSLG